MQRRTRFRILLAALILVFLIPAVIFYFTISTTHTTTVYEGAGNLPLAGKSDYPSSFLIRSDKVYFVENNQEKAVSNIDVKKILIEHHFQQPGTKVNIILTKDAEYNTVVDMLNMMAIMKVSKYELLRS